MPSDFSTIDSFFELFLANSCSDFFLERYTTGTFPYLQDVYSPESRFYSLRIFLQSLKNLTSELVKNEIITQRAFSSLKKLYHKELMNNSIIIALLKRRFVAKIDKINEKNITDIISSIKDRKLKNHIGIFFIFSFRIMKLNKFIEIILNKSRHYNITIPLILALKKNIENMFQFYETMLKKSIQKFLKNEDELMKISNAFRDLKFEYKKIYDREFPYYFDTTSEKINRRKLLKNIVIISDFAIQELVENIAKMFKSDFSGGDIFKNYISRKKKSLDVKKKLIILHTRINDYFSAKGRISPADIFYDINLFIETDLNYLLYKDWNAFLNHYNNLVKTDFSSEFDVNLKSFHSFITEILKEIINKKK